MSRKGFLIVICFMMNVLCLSAQEVDSTSVLSLNDIRLSTAGYESMVGSPTYQLGYIEGMAASATNVFAPNKFKGTLSVPTMNNVGIVYKPSNVLNWKGGAAVIGSGSNSYPGMMNSKYLSASASQNFGKITIGAHSDIVRYGYFHGVSNQYGFGGSITYRISDNFSVSAYGSYYSSVRNRWMTPAMMGFMPTSSYGGLVDIGFGGGAGIMAGVQTEYVPMNRRWEMRPIIAPYFAIKGKRFSVDVGSIFGNMLGNAVGHYIESLNNNRSSRSLPAVGKPGYIPPHRR